MSDLVGIILSIIHFLMFIVAVNSMKNHYTFRTIGLHCVGKYDVIEESVWMWLAWSCMFGIK